ncbi:MAG TPA: arginine--tRNA ligase [Bacteroidota bacterium]|nr:arginine--tRNA ligase [Bacteroidota bacterium]
MKEYLRERLAAALAAVGTTEPGPVSFEKPRQAGHGDLTTNIAMIIAKRTGARGRELAAAIAGKLEIDPALVARVDVAGPGFLNFTFSERYYLRQLQELIRAGASFGHSTVGAGKKVQVEFVSANPTGPLTVGHGRGAVFGDTVARMLEWTGHGVEREYYFNNAGRQMRILGDSVRLRYLELLGEGGEFPGDYYQGEYIRDIARHLLEAHGDGLRAEPATGRFKEQAESEIFADIRKTLASLGIVFASYYNENSLYEEGKIAEVIAALRAKGLAYESEGAVWFKTSALGLEKDKVIVKSTGEPTYRLPDIAYHREKFRRGYDLMIDVFGADHIATFPDVLAALKALGFDERRVVVLIHQFVTILQEGEVVKMSTRKANFITLDELIAEVGADVVRYFFLMRTISSHLNFDLALARKHSDENPVYYLQYAHARICSILRYAHGDGRTQEDGSFDPSLLATPPETGLIKLLLEFPEQVESCALAYEPHRLAEYLQGVATAFHRFYHECRVVTDDVPMTGARLALCRASNIVLGNGLAVLGINAPEQM